MKIYFVVFRARKILSVIILIAERATNIVKKKAKKRSVLINNKLGEKMFINPT